MTFQEAIAYVQACRDSHVPYAGPPYSDDPLNPSEPLDPTDPSYADAAGTPEFHAQTIREYDEALEALHRAHTTIQAFELFDR